MAALRGADIVAAPINTLADVVRDPQAWDNDYFLKTYCEEVQREVEIRGLPVTLSKTPGEVNTAGPAARPGHRAAADGPARLLVGEIEALKAAGAIP